MAKGQLEKTAEGPGKSVPSLRSNKMPPESEVQGWGGVKTLDKARAETGRSI